jgi:UDP-N-acetylglucosamine 1-carboxyvinyltransferase
VKKLTTLPSEIKGVVKISGSKNAALPIIAASLVSADEVLLKNVPNISDIKNFLEILNDIGATLKFSNNKLRIGTTINYKELLFENVKEFRASYYLMSVFLILFGKVKIYYPGGCNIGSRPINFHIEGFKKAGCDVSIDGDVIYITADKTKPFIYKMPKKSLGTTVNLVIIASKIKGTSIIKNASTEPEIDDLISFLNKGNCKIYRSKNDIVIEGGIRKIRTIKHKIIPDRIETFTYMVIGLFSKKLIVKNINSQHLKMPIYYLKKANADIVVRKNKVTIKASKLNNIIVNSGDYPALSTDQMPLLYPVFCRVSGTSIFTEGIFDGRFKVCEELKKNSSQIVIDGSKVFITGSENLINNEYSATDLRGAASLLIECISNVGSSITNLHYLERGYDDIYNKLKKIGLNFKLE